MPKKINIMPSMYTKILDCIKKALVCLNIFGLNIFICVLAIGLLNIMDINPLAKRRNTTKRLNS